MLIRIPVPGVEYTIEFDSDKIDSVHIPHEVADGPPGRRRLTGRASLILRFAAQNDAPKWASKQPADPPRRWRCTTAERMRRCGPLTDCARSGHADRAPGESLEDHAWLDDDGDLDDGYCVPGCPDDICRMSGHCKWPGEQRGAHDDT